MSARGSRGHANYLSGHLDRTDDGPLPELLNNIDELAWAARSLRYESFVRQVGFNLIGRDEVYITGSETGSLPPGGLCVRWRHPG